MSTKTNRFCASFAAAGCGRAAGWCTTPTAGGSGRCAGGGWRTAAAASSPCAGRTPGRGDVFRDPAGRPLATLRPGRDGLALAFTEAVAADPFAKMLVLAAALQG